MNKPSLKAEKRSIFGRKIKKLRREGILPANIYGKKVKSESVQININDFLKVYKHVGETGLVELQVGGSKKPVLIHNLQLDPVTDLPLHADLLQVDLKEKVTAQVPVELIGESPAEKQGLGTVVQYINEIEVEALPGDLPDKFEIDITNLIEVDKTISIKDLPIDAKKVELKDDPEAIIVKVEAPRKEEEIAPPEAELPAEGEVPAEGEEAVPAEESQTGEHKEE